MLTLNFSSCKDDDNDVKKEPEPEKITDVTSSNMSDYLKSQTSGSTITVALTETNPDFAKIREALSNNANVNVKLDLAKCTDLKEIPENAFYKSDNSLKKVGGENGFKNLVAIILPETVVKIGNNAFRDCILLAEINLPDKTEEIGSYVFANCQSLTLIVIPKSVLKIGENVFEGCTQIEIKNNSNVDLNGSNPPDEEITILPNKITKIVGHWTEDGKHDDGDTYYFIYDSEGRVQYVIEESTQPSEYDKRRTISYTYTATSITSANHNYTLSDGLIISYEHSDGKYSDNYSYIYTDGYLTNVTTGGYETDDLEIIDRTFKYTYNNGLITTSEDNVGSKYTYEYTNVKNNLNIDVFAMIDEAGYTTEWLSPFFGKRNKYLPSKMTEVCTHEPDDGTYEYIIAYEFNGDYITKIAIQCSMDGKYVYDEWYEIYYGDVEIPPAPEIQPSLSDVKVTAQANGQIIIDAQLSTNAEIKTLAITNDPEGKEIIADLLKDGDQSMVTAIKEAGKKREDYTLPIPTKAVDVQEMYLYVETEGGKQKILEIAEERRYTIGGSKSTWGSYLSITDNKLFHLAEAKDYPTEVISICGEDAEVIGLKKASKAKNADIAAKAGKVAFYQNQKAVDEISEGGLIITAKGVICLVAKIKSIEDQGEYYYNTYEIEGITIADYNVTSVDISAVTADLSK